jgi:hypothetical protein
MKALFGIVLVVSPVPPNKRFEFGEKLLDGVQARRIRRQIHHLKGEDCHAVHTSLTPVSRLLTHITHTHPRVPLRNANKNKKNIQQ